MSFKTAKAMNDASKMKSKFQNTAEAQPSEQQPRLGDDKTLLKQRSPIADAVQTNHHQQNNDYLRSRISELEEQCRRQTDANAQLYKKLLNTESELNRKSELMARLGDATGWKASQVSELNNRYHELAQGHNQFLDNVRSHSSTMQQQLDRKDEEIARLRGLLGERTDKLGIAVVTQERNYDRVVDQERKIGELEAQIVKLGTQLTEKQRQLDISNLTHKAEGTFMVEVEHLRADVQRLLQMLRNTAEYKDFADTADDSSQSIRFLKDIKARTYVDNQCHSSCKLIRPCMCVKTDVPHWVEDEKLLWVPEEAYKFAHAFCLKYQGQLTDTLIENLLFELNKVWQKREQRLLKRVKGNTAAEVGQLRRYIANTPTYDEHQAKVTIMRLHEDLKVAYKENREAFGQRERRNPPGSSYITNTLKMTQSLHRNTKRQEKELKNLKNKVASMELNKYHDQAEKAIFMEGAQWATSKILSEIDGLERSMITQAAAGRSSLQDAPFSNSFGVGSAATAAAIGTATADTLEPSQLVESIIDNQLTAFKSKVKSINRHSEREMLEANAALKASMRPSTAVITSF